MNAEPHRRPPGRALWELTWACDLRCAHCLVDGGPNDLRELDTTEALDLVDQIAGLGVTAVTLSGGEPLLRPDWAEVAARITERGLVFRLSTNGNLVDAAVVQHLERIGAQRVVMSVDGLRETHDRIRRPAHGRARSPFDRVMEALDRLAPSVVGASVITSVMRPNLHELTALQALLARRGVEQWTIQLAHPTGRAGVRPSLDGAPLLLEPPGLEELFAVLVRLVEHPDLPPIVFNSIGYLGEEEPRVRPSGRAGGYRFWRGCQCGITSVGIEPDGGIKGCANQVGAPFVVGNLRTEPLQAIWDDLPRWHWLNPDPDELTGTCAGCALGKVCGAGCTALAHASSGELFDNPYCIRAVRRPEETSP
jgi:radical SAM protein with 4Fe4S-binding SPASM domain